MKFPDVGIGQYFRIKEYWGKEKLLRRKIDSRFPNICGNYNLSNVIGANVVYCHDEIRVSFFENGVDEVVLENAPIV